MLDLRSISAEVPISSAGPGMLSVISEPKSDIPISTDEFRTKPRRAWDTSSY